MNKKQQIRENFRNDVFERDGHKCVFCDETKDLDAHHITDRHEMPNGGYVKENGITLCPIHHFKAETWSDKGAFSSSHLYSKINSSYKLAYEKSMELE